MDYFLETFLDLHIFFFVFLEVLFVLEVYAILVFDLLDKSVFQILEGLQWLRGFVCPSFFGLLDILQQLETVLQNLFSVCRYLLNRVVTFILQIIFLAPHCLL